MSRLAPDSLMGKRGEKRIARHRKGKRAVAIPPLPLFPSLPILSPLSPNGGAFHGLSCVYESVVGSLGWVQSDIYSG